MIDYYINESELITFTFGGVNSSSFFLYIKNTDGLYNSHERDVEFIEVPGRDGDLVVDNKRKKAKDITLECFLDIEKSKKSLNVLSQEIEAWIQGEVKYKALKISNYNKTLTAICVNQIDIAEEIEDLGSIAIKFRVQP